MALPVSGCVAAIVGACASPVADNEADAQRAAPDALTEMSVDVDWNLFAPREVVRFDDPEIRNDGDVAIQLTVAGSVAAPPSTELVVQFNDGVQRWTRGGYTSDEYTDGSCGAWSPIQTPLDGLRCHATSQAPTNWSYSESKLFHLLGNDSDIGYNDEFLVRIWKARPGADREKVVACRYYQLRYRTGETVTSTNRPCEDWEL